MSDTSLVQFAVRASERLRHVADGLCSDASCVQFCANLKATLSDIINWLQTLPDDERSEKEAAELLEGLLEELESLCQHPRTQIDECSTTPSLPKPPYPALTLLLTNAETVTLAIREFSSNKTKKAIRRRREALRDLGDYLPRTSSNDKVLPCDADLQAASKEPPECGKEIVSLHKTLSTYCVCDNDGASRGVLARIRLHSSDQDDDKVTFGVLFMAHPHEDGIDLKSQPLWQDTNISVLRTTVRFASGESAECAKFRLGPDNPFCNYISAQDREDGRLCLLHFSVTGENLFFEEDKARARKWVHDRPSISLGRLLEEVSAGGLELMEKRKAVLSWLLAKAVWQYYSSPWMLQPWNKESVHFLFERRADQGSEPASIFVNEPLLSISILPDKLGAEDIKASSKQKDGASSVPRRLPPGFSRIGHQLPKILALGVMLVEIQLGKPIESLHKEPEWEEYCPGRKPNINTNYYICKALIEKRNFFLENDISDPLEILIKNCIQPNEFMPPRVRDEHGIREKLYVLVNRLEVYLSQGKPHSIKPLYLPNTLTSNHPSPTPALPPQVTPHVKRLKPRGCTMAQMTNSPLTKTWLQRMDSLNYILKARDGDVYDRVKIAVLDTGIDPNDAAADYISGYRDFVSGKDSVKCDNTGHGTTSVNLVFKICEPADVYAVRIFESDEENDKTLELAIKAIEWCINENMDMICMACGFYECNEDLYEKVREASAKILIFAAPTNESNAGEIAYPARYDPDLSVFCIFSTDGAITNSRGINPSNGWSGDNFAILGEDIRTHSGEVKSGTSFSTAIASGFAGRLLDFSRHSDCKDIIKRAPLMEKKRGMKRVLLTMGVLDEPYRCIKPWQLLPRELRNSVPFTRLPSNEERDEARVSICKKITDSLEEA
ncbi:hypothetical protein ACMFMG_006026 [Clarireedia jacksonii]